MKCGQGGIWCLQQPSLLELQKVRFQERGSRESDEGDADCWKQGGVRLRKVMEKWYLLDMEKFRRDGMGGGGVRKNLWGDKRVVWFIGWEKLHIKLRMKWWDRGDYIWIKVSVKIVEELSPMCRRNVDNQAGTYLTIRHALLISINAERRNLFLEDAIVGGSVRQWLIVSVVMCYISELVYSFITHQNVTEERHLAERHSFSSDKRRKINRWLDHISPSFAPTNNVLTRWQTGTPIQHRLCCKHKDLLRSLLLLHLLLILFKPPNYTTVK